MMKSYLIAGVFATLMCTTVWTETTNGADDVKAPQPDYQANAKVCSDCQLQCDMCFQSCLKLISKGKIEHTQCAQILVDCAECCKLASCLTARNSVLSPEACDCCDKMPDDKTMSECAKSCRECVKACRMIQAINK